MVSPRISANGVLCRRGAAWSSGALDVLYLRAVTGQSVADWHKCADALAAAWRADRLTIRATAPGELRVTVMRGDVPCPTHRAAHCLHRRPGWAWRACG